MRYLEWFCQGIFCCTPFTNYPTNRDYETTCSILQTDASLCEYIFCYLFLYNTVKTFKSVTLEVKFEINTWNLSFCVKLSQLIHFRWLIWTFLVILSMLIYSSVFYNYTLVSTNTPTNILWNTLWTDSSGQLGKKIYSAAWEFRDTTWKYYPIWVTICIARTLNLQFIYRY